MFTPLTTFWDAGYFIVILVAVYGVIGIVKAISEKRFGAGFVFSILSVIFGAAVLFFPGMLLAVSPGFLLVFYFVETGITMLFAAAGKK